MNQDRANEIIAAHAECQTDKCLVMRWQAAEIERLKADLRSYMANCDEWKSGLHEAEKEIKRLKELAEGNFRAALYEADLVVKAHKHIDELESGKPKWVAVSERLPEKRGAYTVITRWNSLTTAHFDDRNFAIDNYITNATHWLEFDIPPVPENQTGE